MNLENKIRGIPMWLNKFKAICKDKDEAVKITKSHATFPLKLNSPLFPNPIILFL